ncbi:hypothetical protein AA14362_1566 [Acetobacter cerevisiae DSM 14362]|nr:hypothetical protein AA14362_1566 [Acetobacter cerevisiae DSM 14362]
MVFPKLAADGIEKTAIRSISKVGYARNPEQVAVTVAMAYAKRGGDATRFPALWPAQPCLMSMFCSFFICSTPSNR